MKSVAVLFARGDSVYKQIDGCDVWDEARDARKWQGGCPVVAHPLCRSWGRLRKFAKPAPHEQDLARFAVAMVRANGGVLEHPAGSTLWADQGLPLPGHRDAFGGWTMPIVQCWWGHLAEKPTWLYIVGCEPGEIPGFQLSLEFCTHVISTRIRKGGEGWRPGVSKKMREETPEPLARWIVELAGRCEREPVAN